MTRQTFPILDNHVHLQPSGLNVEAIKTFEKAGGTHIILSNMPHKGVEITKGMDFLEEYEVTLGLAKKVNEQTGVTAHATVGPYPVTFLKLEQKYGLEHAEDSMRKGMEIAAEMVRSGRAIAIGEIGRPHFDVEPYLLEASNRILRYGMELARDVGCPVVLHMETATPEVCLELAKLADKVGLAREKVVKHYSPPLVDTELNHGIFPSVLASGKAITEALEQGNRFMMETDYLDDITRPGAVLGIKTVPKRTIKLFESGEMSEEDAFVIHKENPQRIYEICINP